MKHLQTLQNKVEIIYKKRLEKLKVSEYEVLLSKVVLLDTELSEFMNEIEDHKLYKLNKKHDKTKQLEELCDCIHVICSIANMLDLQMKGVNNYNNEIVKSKNVLETYKKTKERINVINIARALDNKEYITFMLERILFGILSIAKAKEFTHDEIITAFVAVYTKNRIRANGDY